MDTTQTFAKRGSKRRGAPAARALTTYSTITAEADEITTDKVPTTARWSGVIGLEGVATGDGRLIEPEALKWAVGEALDNGATRTIPFRDVEEDVGEHAGAVVVGSIDKITRRENGEIFAEGDFDLTTERGMAAFRAVESGRKVGVSMDLDSVSFEVRVASEVIEQMDNMMEELLDEEGADEPARIVDKDGRVVVGQMNADDEMLVTTDARVRAATLVAIPAFDEARIEIAELGYDGPPERPSESSAGPAENGGKRNDLTASGAPVAPPKAWFDQPHFSGPTPLTITEDGQVFGHIATWDVCHTASPAGEGICVTAPPSNSNYASFHTGSVLTAEGDVLNVGRLTMAGRHADQRLNARATIDHYENTTKAVADLRAYEDSYGIAVAGALRPGVTPEQVRELRSSPPSGDWRQINGSLELMMVHAVNVAGFPVPRPHGLVASGQLVSLVASGMLAPETTPLNARFSDADLHYLMKLADRERLADRQKLAGRVQSARAQNARRRVAAFAAKLAR